MPEREPVEKGGWLLTRPVWIALAVLMLATPLGLLAGGTAWGEWGAEDFKKPEARAEMAAASGKVQPPTSAPKGLERLASVWTAPMPDYAPPFLKSAQLGYILSAMMGMGLVIAITLTGSGILKRMTS